jgi:hypothetical protein
MIAKPQLLPLLADNIPLAFRSIPAWIHIERTRNASPEEYHAWCEGRMRVRHEFVEQLVRCQSTNQ